MNPQTFFDHFERLTDAPNAVTRLRELVLQLAVQGKLVEQDSTDEPAARLLEHIAAERKRLIKEKKIKEAKLLPSVSDDEVPFEIPDNWRWTRLQDILLKLTDGTHHSPPNTQTGDYKYITAKNIRQGRLDLTNITYVTEQIHQEIFSRCDPQLGDILYIKDGATTGIVAINDLDEPFSMLSSVALLKCPTQLYNRYLFYLLSSPYFYSLMRGGMTGVAITRVTIAKLSYAAIPLPPLEEQKRIVAKVNELMRLCDELERTQAERREARQHLNRATLDGLLDARDAAEFQARWQTITDNFPTLTAAPDQIGKLRQTVLQLAVQGKLTRQDLQDEAAPALLQRIRAERERLIKEKKLKRAAPLPPVNFDETPFALPSGWTWARLGDASMMIQIGPFGSQLHKSDYVQNGTPLVNPSHIKGERIVASNELTVDEKTKQRLSNYIMKASDIVMGRRGEMGKCALVTEKEDGWLCGTGSLFVRFTEHLFQPYLLKVLVSEYTKSYLLSSSVGSTMNNLNQKILDNLLVPIPPLDEQKRIVAAVNCLMALCDELEAGLRHVEEDGERLLRVAVRSLLSSAPENSMRVPALA